MRGETTNRRILSLATVLRSQTRRSSSLLGSDRVRQNSNVRSLQSGFHAAIAPTYCASDATRSRNYRVRCINDQAEEKSRHFSATPLPSDRRENVSVREWCFFRENVTRFDIISVRCILGKLTCAR